MNNIFNNYNYQGKVVLFLFHKKINDSLPLIKKKKKNRLILNKKKCSLNN